MQHVENRSFIGIKVSSNLRKLINRFLETSATYLNISEFTRAALREKIQREAPWLSEEVFRSNAPVSK